MINDSFISINIDFILKKALSAAQEGGITITVSIVDMGGHLLAMRRMDDCSYFAIESSRLKAITASQLRTPTHVPADISLKIPALRTAFDKDPEILPLPGGLPIIIAGNIVAGIGVSGGYFVQDKVIAEKALAHNNHCRKSFARFLLQESYNRFPNPEHAL